MALLSLTVFDGATGVYTAYLDPASVTAIDVFPDVTTWCRVYMRGRETPFVSPQAIASVAAYFNAGLAAIAIPALLVAVRSDGTALHFQPASVTEVRPVAGDAVTTLLGLVGIETPFRIIGLPAAIAAAINAGMLNVTNGTYTPVGTIVSNLDALTMVSSFWIRSGDVVAVFGASTVDATVLGLAQWRFTLPIASNLGSLRGFGGTSGANGYGAITGDSVNDQAFVQWNAGTIGVTSFSWSLGYAVIP